MVKNVNSKSIAAKTRKTSVEADRSAREAKQKEDDYWREFEQFKTRAAKKREQVADRKAVTLARKAETRRFAEQEKKELEESLRRGNKKKTSSFFPKVTEAELRAEKREEAALRKAEKEKKKMASRVLSEYEYEMIISTPNVNRDDSVIEARTVEEALAYLTVMVDRHHKKISSRTLFKAFEEVELPVITAVKPGLTYFQYKDLLSKLWKRCPENPDNMGKGECKVKNRLVSSNRFNDDFAVMV